MVQTTTQFFGRARSQTRHCFRRECVFTSIKASLLRPRDSLRHKPSATDPSMVAMIMFTFSWPEIFVFEKKKKGGRTANNNVKLCDKKTNFLECDRGDVGGDGGDYLKSAVVWSGGVVVACVAQCATACIPPPRDLCFGAKTNRRGCDDLGLPACLI